MLERIRVELFRSRDPGPWIAAARTLAATAVITENASLYLIEIFLETITFHAAATDAELVRIEGEMERIKREHGLTEDEDWYVDEGPEEWQALAAAWDRRDDAIRVAMLRTLGHDEVAELLERDPVGFQERSSAGHQEFWGPRGEESL